MPPPPLPKKKDDLSLLIVIVVSEILPENQVEISEIKKIRLNGKWIEQRNGPVSKI